ncbi:MAG: hypothetical protein CBD25_001835 [Candidatus Pelagibacter sp. TMED165]|nr:MAG: hypothetical protein CBD25_001835 [Candidatus Pelagibacter sp. TMED165]
MKKKINILLFLLIVLFPVKSFGKNSEILKIGNDNAKITVRVFSSLTCPHCASFHLNIFDNLKKEFIDKGEVKFEHHSFPLDMAALNAEKIMRCTESLDKSFQLLGEIYKKQKLWAVGSDISKINESLMIIAEKNNLSKSNILKCLQDENLQDLILNERISAQKKYKISSTPTIYINKKKYEGRHNYKDFKKEIERVL